MSICDSRRCTGYAESNFISKFRTKTYLPIAIVLGLLAVSGIARCRKNQKLADKCIGYILTVLFLVYVGTMKDCFGFFSCETLESGKKFLRADYSIDCDGEEYDENRSYAKLMLLIYPVGVPMCCGGACVLVWY